MSVFELTVEDNKITKITDSRYLEQVDITNGKGTFGQFHYTLRTEDINTIEKPWFSPYAYHTVVPPIVSACSNEIIMADNKLNTRCVITSEEEALRINWEFNNSLFSGFSASLPLNFMSQMNGCWQNQLLVSSPYYNNDSGRLLCLFTRPDGNHIGLIATTSTQGFKIGYSEQLGGHFFTDFEILVNKDRAYGVSPVDSGAVEIVLVPVASYTELLRIATERLDVPAAYYNVSDSFIGQSFTALIIGRCDTVKVYSPSGDISQYPPQEVIRIPAEEYGYYRIVPCFGGTEGIECTAFVHTDWKTMHQKSILSIPVNKENIYAHMQDGTPVWVPPAATYRGQVDTNLCEHTMWAYSLLKYASHFPIDTEQQASLDNLYHIMTCNEKPIWRQSQSIIPQYQPKCKLEKYNTYNSDRIQEIFNGVNILIEYWHCFNDKSYLELAVNILTAQLEQNLKDGCILRRDGTDYTTVTAMILPIVGLYKELSSLNDTRCARFAEAAEKVADFVVKRDLDFPTEGGVTDMFDREMEEGSMACSALTVLYVARYVKYKSVYIEFAQKIMRLHDAYCIYTPTAPMFHSSLRWWENLWEGDADGPALCCGHAWSIWRGEAEFWLGLLSHNSGRLIGSYNTYISNFAKEDIDGNMYSLYQCEPIISGAWNPVGPDISRRYAVGFPDKKDVTLSRYVFARADETWFCCTALINNTVLNGEWQNRVLYSTAPHFRLLYVEGICGPLTVKTDKTVEVFTSQRFAISVGTAIFTTDSSVIIQPQGGMITLILDQ